MHSALLTTDRLIVRPLERGEGESVAAYFRDNREFLQPYYPTFSSADFQGERWEALIPSVHEEFRARRAARFCIFLQGELIGVANLTNVTGRPRHACTLGYSLSEPAQGKGYMREALEAILPWAFRELTLHRIEANYMPRNERSGRVLAALGFEKEGLAKRYLLIDGLWEDHVLTAKINPDWP